MQTDTLLFLIFVIFSGAAVLSTLVLYTRQSLLVAYILLGAVLGPWGLGWVDNPEIVKQVGEAGIIFLLFLLGLNLQPQNLWRMLKEISWIGLVSSLIFLSIGYGFSRLYGFPPTESLIIGGSLMFSSTIIGIKLLPTTILHHQHVGEMMISVLLFQDLIAIIVMLLLGGASHADFAWYDMAMVFLTFPGIFLAAFLVERYILVKLLKRFGRTQEYIFLLSIGWCLGLAELGAYFNLTAEVGALIAGVALAESPIALYIAESLKPLRDFFLVLFFFAIGASFDFQYFSIVFWPALILAGVLLIVKPLVFRLLFIFAGEKPKVAQEVGVRLGQGSEFSLLVGSLAASNALLGASGNYFLQATTIITFIVSSYVVVLLYPTPIALTDNMRKD